MLEQESRSLVTATGRKLLEDGLVVRTWGNISCRVDEDHFLITPSGLDYLQTADEDLVLYQISTGEWEGLHKPSSEKGIHASAYEIFSDANFVIHTHQAYASAMSVGGFDDMAISEEEWDRLGGVALADYGLPGTKMLKKNVRKAMESGAKTILMANHGALIIGESQEDAYEKALLLEEMCKKAWMGQKYMYKMSSKAQRKWKDMVIQNLRETYPNATWVESEPVMTWSRLGVSLTAQLDDMAQMIGRKLAVVAEGDPFTLEEALYDVLEKKNAILVKGFGAIVNGIDEDDTEALVALVNKACICRLHTRGVKVKGTLSIADCTLMHLIYQKKYAKLK